jgi:3-oxoacyl-(acyl-carrier-protein) synthase
MYSFRIWSEKMRRVVITGLGVLSPNGNGIDEFTKALREMRSGIRFFEPSKRAQLACQIGGAPQNVEALRAALFSEEERKAMNEANSYAAIVGLECWRDAKLPDPRLNPDQVFEDTGAVIGAGLGGVDTIAYDVVPMVNEGKARRMGSYMVENTMASGPSAKLASFLGLGAQVTTNSSACVTGTEAIIEAYYKIKEGRANRMIAGGVESSTHYVWACFDAMRVLARNYNDQPEKGSRPLSRSAGGFVPSAGGAVLMLEELETALKRGAPIYAEILGGEVNSGGQRRGGSMTAPGKEGAVRCIKTALARAQIDPKQIDLINGHLTGTFADPHEVHNWAHALQLSPSEFPYIQATKSMIGHALGAAGAIETVASVLQLHHGFIHGSLNCEDLHPELTPFQEKILLKTIDKELNIIAKAGFGFGDVNSCLILRKIK